MDFDAVVENQVRVVVVKSVPAGKLNRDELGTRAEAIACCFGMGAEMAYQAMAVKANDMYSKMRAEYLRGGY